MSYVTRAAAHMHEQKSACSQVTVFIQSNHFKADSPQYARSALIPLSVASDDTRRLGAAALHGLARIYRIGYEYKKAGVMLTGLQPAAAVQNDLFSGYDRERSGRLMGAIDAINNEYGMHTISFAVGDIRKLWRLQARHKSQRFTISWNEIATAH